MVESDHSIAAHVARCEIWREATVEQLVNRLDPQQRYTLVDIGASAGLFTCRMLNTTDLIDLCLCLEPEPELYAMLETNLSGLEGAEICTFNLALAKTSGEATLYCSRRDAGACTLRREAMREADYREVTVKTEAVADWFTAELPTSGALIWKSDTAGFDPLIVSETPAEVWRRVSVASIALWRIGRHPGTVSKFGRKIDRFANKRLGARDVSTADVLVYLQGTDGRREDLLLWNPRPD